MPLIADDLACETVSHTMMDCVIAAWRKEVMNDKSLPEIRKNEACTNLYCLKDNGICKDLFVSIANYNKQMTIRSSKGIEWRSFKYNTEGGEVLRR